MFLATKITLRQRCSQYNVELKKECRILTMYLKLHEMMAQNQGLKVNRKKMRAIHVLEW